MFELLRDIDNCLQSLGDWGLVLPIIFWGQLVTGVMILVCSPCQDEPE